MAGVRWKIAGGCGAHPLEHGVDAVARDASHAVVAVDRILIARLGALIELVIGSAERCGDDIGQRADAMLRAVVFADGEEEIGELGRGGYLPDNMKAGWNQSRLDLDQMGVEPRHKRVGAVCRMFRRT